MKHNVPRTPPMALVRIINSWKAKITRADMRDKWPWNRFWFGLGANCAVTSQLWPLTRLSLSRLCRRGRPNILLLHSAPLPSEAWWKTLYVLAKDDATDVTFSANKPPFPPPPPPPVPDNKLHSCIFGKWQSGRSQKTQSKKTVCSLDLWERGELFFFFLLLLLLLFLNRLWNSAVVTWSVWGVSGCPGPGWGSVWRSPEENGLGSVSPGTPYRFAWQTEGGRGTRGLPSVSNTTVAICFRFLFPRAPFPIILDQPTHESLPGNNRREKERDEFNVDAETSKTPAHNVIPEVLQM